MEFFEERLIAAVEGRPPGESPLAAFGRVLLEGVPGLAQRAGLVAAAARLIGGSPALRTREREVAARYTAQLARVLATETGAAEDDVEAVAVASALMAVHRALLAYVRAAVLVGRRGPDLAAETAEQATRALGRLESGLATYAVREQA
jgi:hypothetical protein